MSQMTVSFNYDALPEEHRDDVRGHAQAIHHLLEKTAENVIEIGRRLDQVKVILPKKREFNQWAKAELGIAQATAWRYREIYRRFADIEGVKLPIGVMSELCRKRVGEEAFQEAIDRAKSGDRLTRMNVQEIIDRHDPPKPGRRKPLTISVLQVEMRVLRQDIDEVAALLPEEELNELIDQIVNLAMRIRAAAGHRAG